MQFGRCHFTCAVDGHEKALAALLPPRFRKIDVQVAGGATLNFFWRALPYLAQKQPADDMALKPAGQG